MKMRCACKFGQLTDRSFAETRNRPGGGLMISALCMYLDQNNAVKVFTARQPSCD
jgi:hypothetical protein